MKYLSAAPALSNFIVHVGDCGGLRADAQSDDIPAGSNRPSAKDDRILAWDVWNEPTNVNDSVWSPAKRRLIARGTPGTIRTSIGL
jgi:hypothetical protein